MSVATMLLGKDVASKIAKNKAGFLNMFENSADDVVERAGKHFDYHSEKVGGALTKDALNAMKQDVNLICKRSAKRCSC